MKRVIAAVVVALFGVFAVVPAQAAPPFKGTYKLTLMPDPSPNAFSAAGEAACFNLIPAARDSRALVVPAGRFTVDLDAGDPLHTGANDWDLFLTNKAGDVLSSSTSPNGVETATVKLKRKDTVNIVVCNLNGTPEATVKYSLKK